MGLTTTLFQKKGGIIINNLLLSLPVKKIKSVNIFKVTSKKVAVSCTLCAWPPDC